MGQYYKPSFINEDGTKVVKWLNSWDFGSGLKLMEHSWMKNKLVIAVENLLSKDSPYHKHKLVWAGDYAEDNLIDGNTIYGNCTDENKHERIKGKQFGFRYLINHTKQEFVDKQAIPKDKDGWQVHPLPLLTCIGNGLGGGDYHSENGKEYIGKWAMDSISVSKCKPNGYTQIKPNFIE